jgi:6-phosphogluconate dehydrogenase
MELGFVGLGRMGGNMVERLVGGGHRVVAYDRADEAVTRAVARGARGAGSVEELVSSLAPPRAVWVMVPAGPPTDEIVGALGRLLARDDTIIDGGNSFFKDDARRAAELKPRGVHYLDVGTSGGIWGLTLGYCLMVGGERAVYERLQPIFKTLAPSAGYAWMGPHGAGHYVKMIHNGIEYGLMQAYAEGFALLEKSDFGLDLRAIAHLWNQGSVIRSWLLELAEVALEKDPKLTAIRGYVEDSGEGRWTVADAIEKSVSAPAITLALFARFRSRAEDSFADRVLAALRNVFGGHAVRPRE